MSERTYSEEEVAAIFAMAAEHQRLAKSQSFATGLTLAEIEEAGREAGFDPATVRAAASGLNAGRRPSMLSKVAVAERWMDIPLEEGAWPDLVASLRRRYGPSSAWWSTDTTSLGSALEWRHASAGGVTTTVMLSPREDGTLLRVVKEDSGMENERVMGWLLAAMFGLAPAVLAGALVAETFGMGDLVGILAVACVLLASVAVGGPLLARRSRNSRRRRAEQVHQIADELVQQLAPGNELRTPEAVSGAFSRLADLPDDSITPENAERNERRRQRH
jgi:hypothetical protein